ncbi:MAG: hypothetical protein ABI577_12395 [bacterium]
MKLLILGESGSKGLALPDPSKSWGNRIPAVIEAAINEPVETVHIRYYPWGKGHMEYLERTLNQGPFDVVILSITKVGFSMYTADNRIRHIFGDRVGDWFKNRIKQADEKTLWYRDDGLVRKVNQRVHAVGAKIIGQAPGNSMETVAAGFTATMTRLARLEDTHVVVLNSAKVSNAFADKRPRLRQATAEYRAIIQAEAKKRRFDLVEREDVLEQFGEETEENFIWDGLHRGDETQPALAEAIAAPIIRRLAPQSRAESPAAAG